MGSDSISRLPTPVVRRKGRIESDPIGLACWFAIALLAGVPSRLNGQLRHEIGVQLTAVSGRPAALMAGPAWAWQAGVRDRLVLHVGAGVSEHQLAGRGEALWQFRFEPSAMEGTGLYLGGGLAAQTAETTHGWIVAVLGLEGRPAAGGGWLVEVGIGGGVRLALGYRWRKGRR